MPYIGNTPADKFLTLAKQSFSTSATTSYTLDSAVSSTQDIALFINNVRQSPVDAYTVSGTALTLTSATAGTDEMYCVYLGKTVGTVSPASNSIATAMLQANAVTGAKLNTDVISAQTVLGATPADTDELLVSDAGVLKRVDYSYVKAVNTPAFHAYANNSAIAIANDTYTAMPCANDYFDSDNAFNTSTYKFIPQTAGKYYVYANMVTDGNWNTTAFLMVQKNQGFNADDNRRCSTYATNSAGVHVSGMFTMNGSSDYIEARVYQQSGGSLNLRDQGGENYFGGFRIIGA